MSNLPSADDIRLMEIKWGLVLTGIFLVVLGLMLVRVPALATFIVYTFALANVYYAVEGIFRQRGVEERTRNHPPKQERL